MNKRLTHKEAAKRAALMDMKKLHICILIETKSKKK